jgi:hypothetical protein
LDGEGYSEVQGRNEKWETGDLLRVPPAMFEQEHFRRANNSASSAASAFGFTDIWPQGYTAGRIYDETAALSPPEQSTNGCGDIKELNVRSKPET